MITMKKNLSNTEIGNRIINAHDFDELVNIDVKKLDPCADDDVVLYDSIFDIMTDISNASGLNDLAGIADIAFIGFYSREQGAEVMKAFKLKLQEFVINKEEK